MNESTNRAAQETTRTCTTAGTTETPEQGRANPRRDRAAHRANTRHLPSPLSLSHSSAPLSFRFLNLLGCHTVRELMRGGIGSLSGRTGASPWSELPVSGRAEVPPESGLPLKRILYIPFRICAYSSNIVIANLVRIESMFAEGTLKYSRFSLNSA